MAQLQATGSRAAATTGGTAVGSITVGANVEGSIVVGNNNNLTQVNNEHGTLIFTPAVPQVKPRDVIPQPLRPPRGFVDRTEEVDQLSRMIIAGEVVALSGPDGAGKTALLKQAASGNAARTKPGGVVMLEGIDEHGTALGLNDVVQRLFDALFESEPYSKVNVTNARTYLSNTQPLVVLDGLNLSSSALAPLPDLFPKGALLVTCTHPLPDDIAQTITVGPLPRPHATELLAAKCGVPIDSTNRITFDTLCTLLDDMPLALVIAGNVIRDKRMALNQARAVLTDMDINTGVQRAFALAYSVLTPDERSVLAVVAASPGISVDLDWLHAALGVTIPVDSVVEHLKTICLLHANSPRLRIDPGLRAIARTGLDEAALQSRLIEYLKAALRTRSLDWAFCADELGTVLGALEWAATERRWSDVITLGRAIDAYLTLHGLWDAWRMMLNRVLEAGLQSGDRANEAWARHQIGTHLVGMGQIDQAIRQLRQALEIRHALGDVTGAAYTQHNLDQLVPPVPPPMKKPKHSSRWGYYLLGIALILAIGFGAYWFFPSPVQPPIPEPSPTKLAAAIATLRSTPIPEPAATSTSSVPATPTPDQQGPEIFNEQSSSAPAFFGSSAQNCGTSLVTLSAVVRDSSGIEAVKIGYQYVDTRQTSTSGWTYIPAATDENSAYWITIDHNLNQAAEIALARQDGSFHWQVVATDKIGNQTTGEEQIMRVLYCAPPTPAWTPTPTFIPTWTPQPPATTAAPPPPLPPATTAAPPPPAPTAVPTPVINSFTALPQQVQAGLKCVTLTWSTSNAISSIALQVNGQTLQTNLQASGQANHCPAQPGTVVYTLVIASSPYYGPVSATRNVQAVASPTPTKDVTGPPAPGIIGPTGGQSLDCSQGVTLRWTAPFDPSGILNYRVRLQSGNGVTWTDVHIWDPVYGTSVNTKNGSQNFTQGGVYYRWRVLARDNAGNGGTASGWAYFGCTIG